MMKRLLPVATALVGFAIPALLALAPPRSAASGAHVQQPPSPGVRFLTLRLGRDVGVGEASQSARILPASFDVDEATGRIDVLDTVNARIASFDGNGRRTGVIPFAGSSRTIADLVRTASGTRYAIDVVRRQLIRVSPDGQTVTDEPALAGEAVNARLDREGDHLYLDDGMRPILGAPPALHVVPTIPNDSFVAFGDTVVPFERPVLDVVEHVIDGRNTLWAVVDLDDGSQRLVSMQLADPTRVQVREVDASVFGDVSRRLVALDGGGAVVMSATATQLIFTRYEEDAR
jgi:hypothetical protein